jgi:hypothetical protein
MRGWSDRLRGAAWRPFVWCRGLFKRMCYALQPMAERGQLPRKRVMMADEGEALLATVRERLAAPQRVKVLLDDL